MNNEQLIKKLQDMAWPDCRVSIEVSPRTSGVATSTPRHVTSYSVKEFIEMLTVEQPQTPNTQSSEGESTETMVEAPTKEELETLLETVAPVGVPLLGPNGTTHPEQQD
ncbi:MAG: hypothetical protein HRU21_13090 [Pseudomonadales bacterium]|nr:hypothetical protein [Pseudomonadales bacterium]